MSNEIQEKKEQKDRARETFKKRKTETGIKRDKMLYFRLRLGAAQQAPAILSFQNGNNKFISKNGKLSIVWSIKGNLPYWE